MADALIQLLKTKELDKITISEICLLAGVNRSTWFRNFKDKKEAISYKLVTLWYSWTNEKKLKETKSFTLVNAISFFEFNSSIKELLILLYSNNLQSSIYDAFYEVMVKRNIDSYENHYYSYALFGLLDSWIKKDFKESPRQMAKIVEEIINQQ